MDTDVEPIEEAEEVEIISEKPSDNKATQFLELEQIIRNHIANIERIKADLKIQREMFEDSFNSDPVFREQAEAVKEANKIKIATRQQILKQPAVALLGEKVKNLKFDLKEEENALSDYLQQYQQMSGATEIEDGNGGLRQIVNVVKLLKK